MLPHRRLPKVRRQVRHADGPSPTRIATRIAEQPRPTGAVTPGELERGLLKFICENYAGRHLDIEVAQLALSNAAASMIMLHLKAVA